MPVLGPASSELFLSLRNCAQFGLSPFMLGFAHPDLSLSAQGCLCVGMALPALDITALDPLLLARSVGRLESLPSAPGVSTSGPFLLLQGAA